MKQITFILFIVSMSLVGKGFAAENAIHWLTIEQAEAKMKTNPKIMLIDMYTDWCGWCKKMDKDTYENTELINYVNEHFYAVKFNAEQNDSIKFYGKKWGKHSDGKVNELAFQLVHGQLSYPTTIFCGDDMKLLNPIPGYMDVHMMEMILKFFGDGKYKTEKWEVYKHDFVYNWKIK